MFLRIAATAGLAASIAACNAAFTTSDNGPNALDPPYQADDAGPPMADSYTTGQPDAGASDGGRITGSPLCNAWIGAGCYPDQAPTLQTCGIGDGDAGSYDASVLACRVRAQTSTADPQAICTQAGAGRDGDACQKGSDCAAGFECVGATGQCRHYCCIADSCNALGHPAFCDVQQMTESQTKVPVCMPVRACKLLDNQCAPGETCEVVRPDGTTSCVQIGAAKAGDPCDKEHCAAGLTCLGPIGSRQCYQLCHTASTTECPAGLRCRTTQPQFQDPMIGICDQ